MTTQIARAEPDTGPERASPLPPRRLWWGYGVWLFVGTVIGTGETGAAIGNPWWPTISATVGHLERAWNPTKIIVVALLAAAAVQVLWYPASARHVLDPGRARHALATSGGRLTRKDRCGDEEVVPKPSMRSARDAPRLAQKFAHQRRWPSRPVMRVMPVLGRRSGPRWPSRSCRRSRYR